MVVHHRAGEQPQPEAGGEVLGVGQPLLASPRGEAAEGGGEGGGRGGGWSREDFAGKYN